MNLVHMHWSSLVSMVSDSPNKLNCEMEGEVTRLLLPLISDCVQMSFWKLGLGGGWSGVTVFSLG